MLINYKGVPYPKADTLLRFAEPEVVLAGHSLPPLSILEIFRYNKEYELILERRDKKCRWHFLDAASGFHVVNVLVAPLFEGC